MTTLIYDNTFHGYLTAVFDVYEYRLNDVHIIPERRPQHVLFGDNRIVYTDDAKAARVWKGLAGYIAVGKRQDIYRVFLCELEGMEDMLLEYIKYTFAKGDVSKDYANAAVLYVAEITRKVNREKHRMEAFVRFRQTADNLYYATVEPDYNVLPLIADHFEKRYADQQWMIYDLRRNYGIYYDLHSVAIVEVDFRDILAGRSSADDVLHESEQEYERLWQNYFKSINITSRKNPKLHKQHMPLRYWKHLTEKH